SLISSILGSPSSTSKITLYAPTRNLNLFLLPDNFLKSKATSGNPSNIWLLRCRVPPGKSLVGLTVTRATLIINYPETTSAHAHSWIHHNAGKLLFAGGVLQFFIYYTRIHTFHFTLCVCVCNIISGQEEK
ncbi:hypothetical protein ACK843_004852, partial [Salmonella enterica]